ncbi:MAG: hypothetical protein ACRENO_10565 [Thermodesulfobacteriota bacterium]
MEGLQVIYFTSEVFAEGTLSEGDQAELTVVFSQGVNPPAGEVPVFFGCAQVVNLLGFDGEGCIANLGDTVATEIDFINIIPTNAAPLLDAKGLIGLVAAFLIIGFFSLKKKKRLNS